MSSNSNIVALDVGDARIGVARASSIARISETIGTVPMNDEAPSAIKQLLQDQAADVLVVGLPRNMSGEETAQTAKVRAFATKLEQETGCKVVFQDESLTSVQAEVALDKDKKAYNKGDVDALAATYILNDYLSTLED